MPSVLLSGLCASDPAGSRAVRQAVDDGLPNHHLRDMSAYPDAAARLSAARRAAALVVTGAPFPRGAATAAAMSALVGRPLIFFGAACGPLRGAPAHLAGRRAVRQARLLLLSDEQSATHLAAAGAPTPMRVAADPAWLALAATAAATAATATTAATAGRARPRGENVAVALDGTVAPPVEQALADALVTVAGTGRRVRLFPWHTGDGPMASRLAARVDRALPGAVDVEAVPDSLTDAAARFAGAHAVVALRYRAVHAAAATAVPAIAVGTDLRTPALAARLGLPAVAPFELTTALPIALERIGPDRTPDAGAVRDEIDRARAGLRLLRLVMEPEAVPAADVDRLPLLPVPWLS